MFHEIFGRRTWLWAIVLILIGILLLRYRGAGPHPVKTLVPAAIPTATAFAQRVVSPARCASAKSLQHSGLGDPCETFVALHGDRIAGKGRIVRGCAGATKVVSNAKDADCVRFAVRGAKERGSLSVWLERNGDGWRIAGASAVTRA